MYLSRSDIEQTSRIKRLNIINSVSGIKPGNLVGTISNEGKSNLAIISSVVHLGSNPPYLGFIQRPTKEVIRHTYENILQTGYFTINNIDSQFMEKAHYTSAKFEKGISEFEECNLGEEYLQGFQAPYVKESRLKIGLKHMENVPIKATNTIMIVGLIEHLFIDDEAIDERGYIDLGKLNAIGISGLNSYYQLNKISEFPYAKVDEVPDFKNEKIRSSK
jgi:flavin reductase (DIM6/NTAB) family NADH-FMN oxidoreductase RutF